LGIPTFMQSHLGHSDAASFMAFPLDEHFSTSS
jgi:hypothetical protein